MGTEILLSLNETSIDYGKNHWWTGHEWLFPPGSRRSPGLSASLGDAVFRMDHMGYSLAETKDRFDGALTRWNRTYDLSLSFERYFAAATSIDFASITEKDREAFEHNIDNVMLERLGWHEDDEDVFDLEDFIRERLDRHVFLRCVAERSENLSLPLVWDFDELIENGWESGETLIESNHDHYVLNHIRLYARLHEISGCKDQGAFDKWLNQRGLAKATSYTRDTKKGVETFSDTLPTAVRNMIHHPENRHQRLDDVQLRNGFEELLSVVRALIGDGQKSVP